MRGSIKMDIPEKEWRVITERLVLPKEGGSSVVRVRGL